LIDDLEAFAPEWTKLKSERTYDDWNLVAELDHTNLLARSFCWGLDLSGGLHGAGGVGGLLAVTIATNGAQFVAMDGNGNVTALVNATNGALCVQYEYGPFGEILRSSGTAAKANPCRSSTKYQDEESDWSYYGYRYYNPNTGRWPNRDPLEEKGGRNLYGFVANNPINNTDTLGLKLSEKEKQCCKCLVFAEGGREAACQQAVLMVLASRQLYASTPPGEKNPFPSSNNEGGFCDQAKKTKTFTGANTDNFRYCMGEKCKVEPTKLEKKLFDQQIGTAAKACDGLDELEIPAGAYYWWNPELSPTNEGIMAWNIQIGNCVEIPTGCKRIKVYSCNSEMKPKGQK
jgi:RHS repeat-associated protein